MLHDLFTMEIIRKLQGGLNNFEHNCKSATSPVISLLEFNENWGNVVWKEIYRATHIVAHWTLLLRLLSGATQDFDT